MGFQTKIKIHFDEADPAGIAFSGGLFTKLHRCYEEFIEALDQDPTQFFLNPTTLFPLRHVEAEYLGPLLPLKTYCVDIHVKKMGHSSFTLEFTVKDSQKVLARLHSTHVACNKLTMEKSPLPKELKENLEKFVIPQ